MKSTCFWQRNRCRCANHLSRAPRPGSRRYYCWRRQNKSPRASLEEEGNKNSFNSLGGGKKKKVLKITLRIQTITQLPPSSAPAPPLAFPSAMCTNTARGQRFSSAASEIKRIPAGPGGSSARCEAVLGPRWVGKHNGCSHTPCSALPGDEGSCHRPPAAPGCEGGQSLAWRFGHNLNPSLL